MKLESPIVPFFDLSTRVEERQRERGLLPVHFYVLGMRLQGLEVPLVPSYQSLRVFPEKIYITDDDSFLDYLALVFDRRREPSTRKQPMDTKWQSLRAVCVSKCHSLRGVCVCLSFKRTVLAKIEFRISPHVHGTQTPNDCRNLRSGVPYTTSSLFRLERAPLAWKNDWQRLSRDTKRTSCGIRYVSFCDLRTFERCNKRHVAQ